MISLTKQMELIMKEDVSSHKLLKFMRCLSSDLFFGNFALEFTENGGCSLLLKLLEETNSPGIKFEVNECFLSLVCHLSIIQQVSDIANEKVFYSIIDSAFGQNNLGQILRISQSSRLLAILIETSPKGFNFFHNAMVEFGNKKKRLAYLQVVQSLTKQGLSQKILNLLDVATKESVLSESTSDIVEYLRKCGISVALKRIETECTQEVNKSTLAHLKRLFGNEEEKKKWYLDSLIFLGKKCPGQMASSVEFLDGFSQKKVDMEDTCLQLEKVYASMIGKKLDGFMQKAKAIEEKLEKEQFLLKKAMNVTVQEPKTIEELYPDIQVIYERKIIRENPVFWSFYQSTRLNFSRLLLALEVTETEFVEKADRQSNISRATEIVIELAGDLVPLPAFEASTTVILKTMSWLRKRKRDKQTANMSVISVSISDIERITEICARRLTFRYKEQLLQIPKDSAKLLGAYAVRRICEGFRSGSIRISEYEIPEQEIVEDILSSIVMIKLKPKDCIMEVRSKPITKRENGQWDEASVFCLPGVCVSDGETGVQWFSGKGTEPKEYGYRLGTLKEATMLDLKRTPRRIQSLSSIPRKKVKRSSLICKDNSSPEKELVFLDPMDLFDYKRSDDMSKDELLREIEMLEQRVLSRDKQIITADRIIESLSKTIKSLKEKLEDKSAKT